MGMFTNIKSLFKSNKSDKELEAIYNHLKNDLLPPMQIKEIRKVINSLSYSDKYKICERYGHFHFIDNPSLKYVVDNNILNMGQIAMNAMK